jgi:hypothetical protein
MPASGPPKITAKMTMRSSIIVATCVRERERERKRSSALVTE